MIAKIQIENRKFGYAVFPEGMEHVAIEVRMNRDRFPIPIEIPAVILEVVDALEYAEALKIAARLANKTLMVWAPTQMSVEISVREV